MRRMIEIFNIFLTLSPNHSYEYLLTNSKTQKKIKWIFRDWGDNKRKQRKPV